MEFLLCRSGLFFLSCFCFTDGAVSFFVYQAGQGGILGCYKETLWFGDGGSGSDGSIPAFFFLLLVCATSLC